MSRRKNQKNQRNLTKIQKMNKFLTWFSNLSLTIKYILAILLIIVPIIFGGIYTQSKNDEMDYYGTSYNIVQSERIRTFLLADYSQTLFRSDLESNAQLTFNSKALLKEQTDIYEEHIDILLYGSDDLDLPPASNEEIIDALEQLILKSDLFLENIEVLIQTPDDHDAIDYISSNTLALDQNLYELGILYEDTYLTGYQQLSTMNFFIIIISIIIVAFALLQYRLVKKIEFQAKYDLLTKLYSRASLYNDIAHLSPDEYGIIFLDIHRFKEINDVYGPRLGDKILKELSNRIKDVFSTSRVYRFGGDEFVILIKGSDEFHRIAKSIDSIHHKLIEPFTDRKNRSHNLLFSIGVAGTNLGFLSFDEKLKFTEDLRIDSRNYRLKPIICNDKGNCKKRIHLKESILTAIDENQIEAFFQPLHYTDGSFKGFEALARWNLDNEHISPGKFIPLINANGMGYELDLKMIELIGKAYPLLCTAKEEVTPIISVNLAVDTITNVSAQIIIDALQKTNIPLENIVLEILEDVIISDKTRLKLAKLSEQGYTIALDDFTTGATSFDYLTLDEFDIVKIDQSVVKQLEASETRHDVLKDLIQMIHTSNKDVIIEGIETKEEIEAVSKLGVDVIQGYFYTKPIPINEAIEYIKNLK